MAIKFTEEYKIGEQNVLANISVAYEPFKGYVTSVTYELIKKSAFGKEPAKQGNLEFIVRTLGRNKIRKKVRRYLRTYL